MKLSQEQIERLTDEMMHAVWLGWPRLRTWWVQEMRNADAKLPRGPFEAGVRRVVEMMEDHRVNTESTPTQ